MRRGRGWQLAGIGAALAALSLVPAGAEKMAQRSTKPAPAHDATADPREETRHKVLAGETLGGIAARAQVPRILIIEANALKPPYAVRDGQVLVIPRRRVHVTKPDETGFAIAMDYGVPWSAIAAANGLDARARVRAGQKLVIPTMATVPPSPALLPAPTPVATADADGPDSAGPRARADAPVRFAWPAPGMVRRGFLPRAKGAVSREGGSGAGRRSPHDGIDIAGAKGDPVRAAAAGLVWYAGKEPNLYGNVVIVDHGQGWFSAYAKLSKVTVAKGERVRGGERVGLIGDTGSTPTTELHFEIRRKTVPIDPLKLLPERR